MRIKSLVVGALMCCFVGCANKATHAPVVTPVQQVEVTKPEPTQPVVVQETIRVDLPLNWTEVKGKGWSYGLPIGFDAIKLEPNPDVETLAAHASMDKGLRIVLDKDKTSEHDLFGYVTAWLMVNSSVFKKDILATTQKATTEGRILSAQLFWEPEQGKYSSSLEFFVEKDNIIYHLSCSAEQANKLKQNADVCFDVMDTLKVK